MRRVAISLFLFLSGLTCVPSFAADLSQEPGTSILLYHRFRPNYANFTTVQNDHFENQIVWLKEHGFNFVKLSTIVDAIREGREPAPKSIAITVDDGHFTQYQYMFPILKKHQVPATLFIYTDGIASREMPNVISWDQLREMQATGLIDIQAHSLSHPDFVQKRRTMSPDAFHNFAMTQLIKSKEILEEKLGQKVSYFAWPYGSFDRSLEKLAEKAGYVAAFGTEGAHVHTQSNLYAIPRFHIMNDVIGDRMASIVMPMDKKRTRVAIPSNKATSPPRVKVKPSLLPATEANTADNIHDEAKLLDADAPIPPHNVPTEN